jgi:hypothetical protein
LDLILGQIEGGSAFERTLRKLWLQSASDADLDRKLDALGDRLVQARDRFAGVKEAELIVSSLLD